MLLSKSCKYGLRATILLAALDRDSYVSIRDLSNEMDISFHFLTKILQKLKAAGLLDSRKGVNGGVKLSLPSNHITFMDVVVAIDGTSLMNDCILGLPGCGEKRHCPMHDQWSAIKAGLLSTIEAKTLQYIISEKRHFLYPSINNNQNKSESAINLDKIVLNPTKTSPYTMKP